MWSETTLADALKAARVFDLEQPRFAGMPIFPSHRPGYHYALHRRHRDTYRPTATGQRSSASGMITMMEHTGTHIDALCHQACGLQLHGGVSADKVESPTGFTQHGVETVPPLVGRGVLLDLPRHRNVERLPPRSLITAADLAECAASQQLAIRAGDIVLVRTGFDTLWNDEASYLDAAGIAPCGTRWIADHGVLAVGADNMAWDAPSVVDSETGSTLFAHVHLLVRKGIYIMENLRLVELSAAAATEFAIVVTPLKLMGATGSPIRPLAFAPASAPTGTPSK